MEPSGAESRLPQLRLAVTTVWAMLTFLLLVPSGHAANIDSIAPEAEFVVELPFVAKPGDRFVVSYDYSWNQRAKGQARLRAQLNWTADGKFLKRRPDGYTIGWIHRKFLAKTSDRSNPAEAMAAHLFNALHEVSPNEQFVFTANQKGHPIHAPNWKGINTFRTKVAKERLPGILERVAPQIATQLRENGQLSPLLETLITQGGGFTFKDGKAAALDSDAAVLMAAAQNIALPRIGKFEWKKAAPVIGNEDETKSKTMVWFDNFNRQINVVEIRWRTEFDESDLKNSTAYKDRIDELLDAAKAKGLGSAKPEEVRELAIKHLHLERIDEGFATVRISDGWTQDATYEKRLNWSIWGAEDSEIHKHRVRVKRLPTN